MCTRLLLPAAGPRGPAGAAPPPGPPRCQDVTKKCTIVEAPPCRAARLCQWCAPASFCAVYVFGNFFAPCRARTTRMFFFQHLFHFSSPPQRLSPSPTCAAPHSTPTARARLRSGRALLYKCVSSPSSGVRAARASGSATVARTLSPNRHSPIAVPSAHSAATLRLQPRLPPAPMSPSTMIDCEWSECLAARALLCALWRVQLLSPHPTLSTLRLLGRPFAAQIGTETLQWWLAMAWCRCVASDTRSSL